jgi:hypothetical protein
MSIARIDYPAFDRDGRLQVVRGTPTKGATLDNEFGIAPLPEGWTEYSNEYGAPPRILVSGPGAIDGDVIVDRRPWANSLRW